jgi:hypothetical protein
MEVIEAKSWAVPNSSEISEHQEGA